MAPSNSLTIHGNQKTMNLNSMILTNIQSSPYFKNNLYELKTYHEVIDEIYNKVGHLEPWEKGSRKTAGQTGMCGGVRGVGAGGIVSSAFCLLYKLFTLKLTRKQVMGLVNHSDSPYIRGLGFMYIRYTQPPGELFDWYEYYLDDPEEIDVKAGGGCCLTIGDMLRQWLVKLEWYSTLFPRIPVPIQKQIEQRLRERQEQMMLESGEQFDEHEQTEENQAPETEIMNQFEEHDQNKQQQQQQQQSRGSKDRESKDAHQHSHHRSSREKDEHRRKTRDSSRERHRSRSRDDRHHHRNRSDRHHGDTHSSSKHHRRHHRSSSRDRHRESKGRSRDYRHEDKKSSASFEDMLHREKQRQHREHHKHKHHKSSRRERSQERSKEHSKERSHDRSKEHSQERSRDRSKERSRDRNGDA